MSHSDINVGVAIVTALFMVIFMIGLWVLVKLERILDRYRLKYGFDREIERKETSGDNTSQNEKLNRRERLFKRRVFKD